MDWRKIHPWSLKFAFALTDPCLRPRSIEDVTIRVENLVIVRPLEQYLVITYFKKKTWYPHSLWQSWSFKYYCHFFYSVYLELPCRNTSGTYLKRRLNESENQVWILKPQNYKYVMVNLFSRLYSAPNLKSPNQKTNFESLQSFLLTIRQGLISV